MELTCSIPLPESFRPKDILAFHRRDGQEIAERVSETSLTKAMVWHDIPVCLQINFHSGQAVATLTADGGSLQGHRVEFERMVKHMLGLNQRIDAFEEQFRSHPQIGVLIARHPGLRVPLTATPFEALTWAITGQQISVSAAVSIRRKLITATNIRHAGGLLCHPQARQILDLPEGTLRQAGFSTTKAQTLLAVSALMVEGHLPLDTWTQTLPVETIRVQLEGIRGIGPWTVNYTLLRGFGWLDGSLHGDVAVRRGLQTLLGRTEKVSEGEAKAWLAQFEHWRALIGAHIWATLSPVGY